MVRLICLVLEDILSRDLSVKGIIKNRKTVERIKQSWSQ